MIHTPSPVPYGRYAPLTVHERHAVNHTRCPVSVSSQHFPEKFASVRPARRLVVNSTFLTSHSTVTNSVLSASTVRSWGYGAASFDGQTDRRP